MKRLLTALATAALCLLAASCGGGGASTPCDGSCGQGTLARLEVSEIQGVMARAVAEATARNARATIAVVDRVGNVLGVFRMRGADIGILASTGTGVEGGLEGIDVIPDTLAAIAKAVTGAFLSTQGNAFTTRTANQIVQANFNVGERNQPGGPLFGVQFSSLPCSDLNRAFSSLRPSVGPARSPLGLAADPGGFPLYKNGVMVGGVGVIADSVYGADLNISDTDQNLDELIALAATIGFDAPEDRRADRITVDAKNLRYSDAVPADLLSNAATAPNFMAINGPAGELVSVRGYMAAGDASIRAGTVFGNAESGIRPATLPAFAANDGFVLVDANNQERFPPKGGTDGALLGASQVLIATEVATVLEEALKVANRERAQIRRPLSSQSRVTISVIDTYGTLLGLVRTRDAPVFGTDVSLQKARSVAFFSNREAGSDLASTPDTTYFGNNEVSSIAAYVPAVRAFLDQPRALSDGAFAYANRSVGNLARPFFPDGIEGAPAGPLSKPAGKWSPFSTGLQLDLANSAILSHVVFVLGGGNDVAPGSCTQMPVTPTGFSRLPNGLQIFAGGVPIYRGTQLVGAIGISGDGIDQDDLVAFMGVHNASQRLGGAISNAPPAIRADTISRNGVFLRYVQCPQAPYLDSDEQNVCANK